MYSQKFDLYVQFVTFLNAFAQCGHVQQHAFPERA